MLITNEIASITILLTFQKGKEVVSPIIPFKVFRQEKQYKVIPLITSEERKRAGLSDEHSFTFKQNRIIAESETNEASLTAINYIAVN